jgi:hypothetical protein
MSIHPAPHPMAGQTVTIKDGVQDPAQGAVTGGAEYRLEDWWDRVGSAPWGDARGNPACLHYAMRIAGTDIPPDDEVVYGKIGPFGHLVHVSEIKNGNGVQ